MVVRLIISWRSASLSLAAAAWNSLASYCILASWSEMAWIAAACLSAGCITTEGCIPGALGAGGSGLYGGSGWFRAASGEAGLSSCWWAALAPLPLSRGWWRQGGGPPGLPHEPPGGWGPTGREGAFLVLRRRMAALTSDTMLEIHE